MEILFITTYFILGTIIGSFLNVVVLRYYLVSSLIGRSFCFSCGKNLKWYELIPLFSYIALKGHCRSCKSSISIQYPLIELATGLLFAGLILKGVTGLELIAPTISISVLVAILVYDFMHKIVPDALVYTFISIAFLFLFIDLNTLNFVLPTLGALFAGPVLFLPFFALWFYSKGEWMGLGDGKLALGIGWYFGFAGGISAIVLAFWLGALVSVLLLLLQKIKKGKLTLFNQELSLKSEIPFAPFIIAGFLIVFYFEFNLAVFIL